MLSRLDEYYCKEWTCFHPGIRSWVDYLHRYFFDEVHGKGEMCLKFWFQWLTRNSRLEVQSTSSFSHEAGGGLRLNDTTFWLYVLVHQPVMYAQSCNPQQHVSKKFVIYIKITIVYSSPRIYFIPKSTGNLAMDLTSVRLWMTQVGDWYIHLLTLMLRPRWRPNWGLLCFPISITPSGCHPDVKPGGWNGVQDVSGSIRTSASFSKQIAYLQRPMPLRNNRTNPTRKGRSTQ